MKKIISLLVLSILLVACTTNQTTTNNEINYISSVQAMEKMDNNDSFFLVIGISTCSACIAYKPVLEELVKNKEAEIYYVQTDTEADRSTEDRNNVIKFFEEYLNDQVNTTPSTIYIHEGEVEKIEVGNLRYTDLVAWVESK